MARRRFRILNIFAAGGPFTGNPLCVFEDGRGLTTAAMQALARQFHLSETTFLLPSEAATARVRIFTTAYELPFAGHPTLGSAAVVSSQRRGLAPVTLEMGVGVIPVRRVGRGRRWEFRAATPLSRDPSGVAPERLLRIPASSLLPGTLFVDAGSEQLLVPVRTAAAVRSARPDPDLLSALGAEPGKGKVLVFAETGTGTVEARFFFVQGSSIEEDPATGSACANLGGWYLARGADLPLRRRISQGAAVGRPSRLHLSVTSDRSVLVAGEVREIGRGTVEA